MIQYSDQQFFLSSGFTVGPTLKTNFGLTFGQIFEWFFGPNYSLSSIHQQNIFGKSIFHSKAVINSPVFFRSDALQSVNTES